VLYWGSSYDVVSILADYTYMVSNYWAWARVCNDLFGNVCPNDGTVTIFVSITSSCSYICDDWWSRFTRNRDLDGIIESSSINARLVFNEFDTLFNRACNGTTRAETAIYTDKSFFE